IRISSRVNANCAVIPPNARATALCASRLTWDPILSRLLEVMDRQYPHPSSPHRVPLRPGSAGKGPLWCICSRNFLPRRPLYRSWQVYVSHQRRRSRYRAGEPQGARRFLYVKAVRDPAERKLVVTPENFALQVMLRPDPERALAGSNRETIRPLLAASVLREMEEDLDIVGLFALQDILNPDPATHRIVCKVAAMLHRVGQSHVTVMRCANGLGITFQVNVLNGRMCVFRP